MGAARPIFAAVQPGAKPPPACALTAAASPGLGNVGSKPLYSSRCGIGNDGNLIDGIAACPCGQKR
jgi:hypothetical protein